MNFRKTLLAALAVAGTGFAATSAQAANPYYYSDGSAITITGKVQNTTGDNFMLDYGTGSIRVDMDDWDWYVNEAERLKVGETVTVVGEVDDSLFANRQIEADNVYVHERYTYYYSDSDADDSRYTYYSYASEIPEGSWVSATGTVSDIDGRELTLNTAYGNVRVDTDGMRYNPLDDEGYQRIKTGDRISVSGQLSEGFFDNREIEASSLVSLMPNTVSTGSN